MKTGIIEVIVKLYLNTDVGELEAREIVNEMDYDFEHKMISQTEIVDYELIKP